MKTTFISLVALILLSAPALSLAQSSFDAACMTKGGCWGPLITCNGDYSGATHGGKPQNTCTSVCDFAVLINTWIFFFYSIILYILLPLGVAIGGFIWLTSAGSAERITMARGIFSKTFTWFAVATVAVLVVGFIISQIGIGATNNKQTPLGMSIVCDKSSDSIKILDPGLEGGCTYPSNFVGPIPPGCTRSSN